MAVSKRTPELKNIVLTALRNGQPKKFAARIAGIHPSTLENWMLDDPEFEQEVEQARASWAQFHLANINRSASNGNWLASAWALERSFPELYSRVDRSYAIMHVQVADLREELRRDGIEISEAELLKQARKMIVDKNPSKRE